ncbi:hypothetical protein [Algoriphagus sediminis]|uniref:Lipocalin-like domain-containing protein n=1 Tax=Algoriphagus sediminis TaxID=3057113 RepID=A0ABT7YC22_9BACT|nr:hypothetical protein [Algoriphagus sediminis]MDN3204070.1 hypothetical protein [Algoriphagus sediminis]
MKLKINVALFALWSIFSLPTYAQDITGLWEVINVQVGEEEMTPIARWTRINENGTFESGNGWLKSSFGTYDYNEAEKSFLPTETEGLQLESEFGAFKVEVMDEEMIWKREENGEPVTVLLSRIDELPKAPADKIIGLWMLTHIKDSGASDTRAIEENELKMFLIRWDRIYREMSMAEGRKTGYWHMNAHRPQVTMLPHTEGDPAESWALAFSPGKLTLTGISDSNRDIEMIFARQNKFPD